MATPNPIDVHVGQVVRRHRLERRFSLERLAEAVGITYQQVQKYERGVNRISASMLYRIAEGLDVPVGNFFPGSAGERKAPPMVSRDDLRTAYALDKIEDATVRVNLRGLIEALSRRPASLRTVPSDFDKRVEHRD